MIDLGALARSPLLQGLATGELEVIAQGARQRTFAAGETVCAAGDPGERCWIVTGGLVDVVAPDGGRPTARERRGATIGEIASVLGQPYPETVIASIPTTTIELEARQLAEMVRRFPQILVNVLGTAQSRWVRTQARRLARDRGETVAVAAGPSLRGGWARVLALARTSGRRSVTVVDRGLSFAGALTSADDLVAEHATVLVAAELDAPTIEALLREADRVVALAGTAEEAGELARLTQTASLDGEIEVIVFGDGARRVAEGWSAGSAVRVIRQCRLGDDGRPLDDDLQWLARHLTRTKLGLALGAGGAKGHAHVGVLQVLEEAGYVVDAVAGSSIGAIIGACIALGADAAEIDGTLRGAYTPEAVAEIFRPSMSGRASGLELMTSLLREITGERTFADTSIPLTVMAVSLTDRAPAPLRDGPLWEALLAATALAGVFPPQERRGHRLVDGLALVPVPTGAVLELGADVTVAVNLIGRETLPQWPGGPAPEPPAERRRRGVLENLLEVMDLSQLAESVRHTELADVPITPRFGPGEWRDFHLADLFLQAGREAATEQLATLASLAVPVRGEHDPHDPHDEGESVDRADAIRI